MRSRLPPGSAWSASRWSTSPRAIRCKPFCNRDIPVLQGSILLLAMVFVATNLLVDLLHSAIDPRIRRA